MTLVDQGTIRKVTSDVLEVGLICADRDGNRVRIDRLDRQSGIVSYHFLNDELRVQEGVRELPIHEFLAEGWYLA
jgi:DNA-binding transcriptional ArsR family regulator